MYHAQRRASSLSDGQHTYFGEQYRSHDSDDYGYGSCNCDAGYADQQQRNAFGYRNWFSGFFNSTEGDCQRLQCCCRSPDRSHCNCRRGCHLPGSGYADSTWIPRFSFALLSVGIARRRILRFH